MSAPKKKRGKAGTSKQSAANRRALYIEAFISNGGSKRGAAIAAGFKPGRASDKAAERMSHNVAVVAEIERRRSEVVAKAQENTQLTVDEVLASLARDIRFDPLKVFKDGKLVPFDEMDPDTRRAIRGLSYDAKGQPNIKFPEQTAAREQGMKHFGLYEKDNEQGKMVVLIAPPDYDKQLAEARVKYGKPSSSPGP